MLLTVTKQKFSGDSTVKNVRVSGMKVWALVYMYCTFVPNIITVSSHPSGSSLLFHGSYQPGRIAKVITCFL